MPSGDLETVSKIKNEIIWEMGWRWYHTRAGFCKFTKVTVLISSQVMSSHGLKSVMVAVFALQKVANTTAEDFSPPRASFLAHQWMSSRGYSGHRLQWEEYFKALASFLTVWPLANQITSLGPSIFNYAQEHSNFNYEIEIKSQTLEAERFEIPSYLPSLEPLGFPSPLPTFVSLPLQQSGSQAYAQGICLSEFIYR